MPDQRDGSVRCRNCRHFWGCHVETNRALATDDEVQRRRCNDCSVCLQQDGAPIGGAGRELVDA